MELKVLVIKQDQKTIYIYKKKQGKKIAYDNLHKLFSAREMVLNGFNSKIFSIKPIGSGLLNTDQCKLKILTPKQMLQRLPIALAYRYM